MSLRTALGIGLIAAEGALKVMDIWRVAEERFEDLKDKRHEDMRTAARKLIRTARFESSIDVQSYELPELAELGKRCGRVDEEFYISPRHTWTNHPSVDQTPGHKNFLLKHFNREIGTEEAIETMSLLGYRPANHIELWWYELKMRPRIMRFCAVVALGSKFGESKSFACTFYNREGEREALSAGDDGLWNEEVLLFVRK